MSLVGAGRSSKIRQAFADGYNVAECAYMFGCTQNMVRKRIRADVSFVSGLDDARYRDIYPRHESPRVPEKYRSNLKRVAV
jgi:hypothetical protein